MKELTLTAQATGERIDSLLACSIPGFSRSVAQRLIGQGRVTLNGKIIKKNYRVTEGETFLVTLPALEPAPLLPQDIQLDIVFEDQDLIVVNKPRGMVVHPAPGHPDNTLVNALLHHCAGNLSGVGGQARPGIVHRLDKDTSGLILVAKNDRAHLDLSFQLSSRSLGRIYEGVAAGNVKEDKGLVNAPIGRHPADRKRMAVIQKNGRPAVTRFEVLARYKGYTHLRCQLETGRTHQIRVHLAHLGHPLLGDLVYGGKRPEKGLSGQCLHAKTLRFTHPRTREEIQVTSDLPDYFLDVISRLGPKI